MGVRMATGQRRVNKGASGQERASEGVHAAAGAALTAVAVANHP